MVWLWGKKTGPAYPTNSHTHHTQIKNHVEQWREMAVIMHILGTGILPGWTAVEVLSRNRRSVVLLDSAAHPAATWKAVPSPLPPKDCQQNTNYITHTHTHMYIHKYTHITSYVQNFKILFKCTLTLHMQMTLINWFQHWKYRHLPFTQTPSSSDKLVKLAICSQLEAISRNKGHPGSLYSTTSKW
jgi:hypothetical protein